jgi:hypothetical protein
MTIYKIMECFLGGLPVQEIIELGEFFTKHPNTPFRCSVPYCHDTSYYVQIYRGSIYRNTYTKEFRLMCVEHCSGDVIQIFEFKEECSRGAIEEILSISLIEE